MEYNEDNFYKHYFFKFKKVLKAIKSHTPRHELITVGDFLLLCSDEQLVRCNGDLSSCEDLNIGNFCSQDISLVDRSMS